MIRLTRLNHQPIVINAEMIEYLESTPDTVISLVNGQKMTVLEELDQVMAEVIEYKRRIGQRSSGGEESAKGGSDTADR